VHFEKAIYTAPTVKLTLKYFSALKDIHTSEHMVLRFNQHFRNLTFLLQMTAYLTGNIELDDNLHFTVF